MVSLEIEENDIGLYWTGTCDLRNAAGADCCTCSWMKRDHCQRTLCCMTRYNFFSFFCLYAIHLPYHAIMTCSSPPPPTLYWFCLICWTLHRSALSRNHTIISCLHKWDPFIEVLPSLHGRRTVSAISFRPEIDRCVLFLTEWLARTIGK